MKVTSCIKQSIFFVLFASFLHLTTTAQLKITPEEAKDHIGENVTVCGKIFEGKFLESTKTQPTLFNMGASYPNQLLTVLIAFDDRGSFPSKPEEYYANTNVCVTGTLIVYKDKPEIKIRNSQQIELTQVKEIPRNEAIAPSKNAVAAKRETAPKKEEPVAKTKDAATPSSAYDITLTASVNMRSGPGTDYPVTYVLKAGTTVSIVMSSNGWSQVNVIKNPNGTTMKEDLSGYIKNAILK